jgi:hypothetical protein
VTRDNSGMHSIAACALLFALQQPPPSENIPGRKIQ